ncbi:MAG: hypothetical protein AAFW68_14535, partial [Pseudomonadota bacterium]
MEIAENAGATLFIAPFTDHEHGRYSLLPKPRELGITSKFLTFLIATAQAEFADSTGRNYVRISRELAYEYEQAELQRVHLAAAFRKFYDLATIEQEIRAQRDHEVSELRSYWETASAAAKQEQKIRFEAVEQLTRQIDANAEEVRRQQHLHLAATEELKRQQQLHLAATEELKRQKQLHEETVGQFRLEADTLAQELTAAKKLNKHLDSKLAVAERR